MKGSYKSRWVIVIVVVIAAIAAFWFWQGRNDSQSAAPGATKQAQQSPAGGRRGMRSGPLAPVQAATAVEQAVPRYLTGLGTITAANTVTVRSRVDGQLMALHFQEGQQVKAGDLLAEIDPSQFKVALGTGRFANGSPGASQRRYVFSCVSLSWYHGWLLHTDRPTSAAARPQQ